jgi:hypothetical protein
VFFCASASSASAVWFTPGVGNVIADAIHAQHPQREEHAVPQVG